jgi:hypothetical protein
MGPSSQNNSVLAKKLVNPFHTPFSMTSRPVDSFALTAPIKYIMGFPDIIGYQTINIAFIDLANGKVAVNASGKRPGIIPLDTDLTHNLFELLNEKVGRDEDVMMIPPQFLSFLTSGNQYSMVLEPVIKFSAGSFRFVDGVITQNTKPFG